MTDASEPRARSAATPHCVFCSPEPARIAWSGPLTLALWDSFPVSPGHALVVPRRHAAGWADLTAEEKAAIFAAVDPLRAVIAALHSPDGFNIGCNDGVAAGQTVMHFHLHVIPRYAGDAPDPRGGVRWAVPAKARYWKEGAG
jgi:diadenosine tetraphosphate (Ap4A) HIT family hydrolase